MKRNFERTNTYNIISRNKIGGDTTNKKIEEWIETLNLENASIIEYTIIREIHTFIDADVREELKEPLELIEKKYKKRKNYFDLINFLKEEKRKKPKQYSNNSETLRIGNYSKNKEGIDYDNITIEMKKKFIGDNVKQINKSYDNIIVGIEIINKSEKQNGKYTFVNPLLENQVNITFRSSKELNFEVNIYTAKKPE